MARHGALAVGVFILVSLVSGVLGQTTVDDNPFPDVIARARVMTPFDDTAPKVNLTGVITQQPTHIRPRNPYQYFRMAVTDPSGTASWAVLLRAADDEVANLRTGVSVTILATPTKDGSRRVELVQSFGPNRSGLMNLAVNAQ